MRNKPHKYTEEEKAFLADYVPGHSHKEIAEEFSKRFGHIEASQIKGYIKTHHLNTGRTGRFEKGCIPANKGIPMSPEHYEKSKATMFKKGQKPVNSRPVGSERISVDGYIEVKIKEPRTWKFKHRVIWEEHNGPIPKGQIVIFKDNNPLNCDIDNLMLISRQQLLYLNRHGLSKLTGEAKETTAILAQLSDLTEKKKKEGAKK